MAFQSIKHQVYRIALPLLSLSVWLTYFIGKLHQPSPFNDVVLPLLAVLLAIAATLVWTNKLHLSWLEYGVYALLAAVLVAKYVYSFSLSYEQSSGYSELVQIFIWTSINFVLAYFLFEQRIAFIGTTLVYLLMLAASVIIAIMASPAASLQFPDRTLDFFLANTVELSLLYGVSMVRSRLAELRGQLVQLEKLANIDMLTGIPNRRQLEATLHKELSSAERYNSSLSVIAFDIDRFKQINDTHGHDLGDYVLKTISQLFSEFLRDTDWLGRWGGEEFLVIASQTPLKGAMILAERLRKLLAEYSFDTVGHVTASFGVASYQAGDTLSSLTKRADEALYMAKDYGRNRVEAVETAFVNHVQIPELYCPFEVSRLDKLEQAEQLRRGTVAWLAQFKVAPKKTLYRWVSAVDPGWLAAHIHQDAADELAQLLSDWYLWMFLHDDRCDESDVGRNPQRLSEVNARLLEIFKGEPLNTKDDPLAQLFYDLGLRLRRQSNRSWFRQLLTQVEAYFAATVWEASNRAEQRIPALDQYIAMRPAASGVAIDTTFIKLVDELDLPEDVLGHPLIEQLSHTADLAVCWANDLFSLNKEVHHKDMHNLVIALQQEARLPLQRAVDQAVAMHNQLVQDFIKIRSGLPQFEGERDQELERYLSILAARMKLNILWSQEIIRYKPSELVRVTLQEVQA